MIRLKRSRGLSHCRESLSRKRENRETRAAYNTFTHLNNNDEDQREAGTFDSEPDEIGCDDPESRRTEVRTV